MNDLSNRVPLTAMVEERVRRSGSSFYWAMRMMEPARRQAMYAVYAFCREVDDIADEPGDPAVKRRQLGEWRQAIADIYGGRTPDLPYARALVPAVQSFGLVQEDLLAVVDGCEMDVGSGLVRPPMATLDLYCDRVACAVGRLSVRIFGEFVPAAIEVANHQGRALQLTNILRDVWDDAQLGRVYLPDELLNAHGITGSDPQELLKNPRLAAACRDLAKIACDHYAAARAAMARCPYAAMRPARIMMEMYHLIFLRGEAKGWEPGPKAIHIPKMVKLWYVFKYALF